MLYLRKTHDLVVRHAAVRLCAAGRRCFSKDYNSSDDEKEPKHPKVKKEHSKTISPDQENMSSSEKLNRLLASMETLDNHFKFTNQASIVAKPGEANRKKKLLRKREAESKDIFAAAKQVASMLGGENQKQTESELLSGLFGGKPSASNTKSEEDGGPNKEGNFRLSEILVGMKINRHKQEKVPTFTRSEYVRRSLAGKRHKTHEEIQNENRPKERKRVAELHTGSVNLTGGNPLGIFTDSSTLKDSVELLPTWSYLHEQALKIQVSHPPSNYFDKIARWTEQGKVWRFPIDNEQDWLDEKDVDFTEHIFLEQHLEGWCPNRGPIRHYMELVCVGLSKNPYITAKEKKDHIIWYKNYFESKKDILTELLSDNPKSETNITDKQQKQVKA